MSTIKRFKGSIPPCLKKNEFATNGEKLFIKSEENKILVFNVESEGNTGEGLTTEQAQAIIDNTEALGVLSAGSTNSNSEVITLDNLNGTWIGSTSSPKTSITFDLTNAVNGAVSVVYYKAETLDIQHNGTLIINKSLFSADELCVVWLIYDKGSNTIHVNVQKDVANIIPKNYGLEFLASNTDNVIIPNVEIDFSKDMYFETRFKIIGEVDAYLDTLFGSYDTSYPNNFRLYFGRGKLSNSWRASFGDSVALDVGSYSINTWVKLKIEYTASTETVKCILNDYEGESNEEVLRNNLNHTLDVLVGKYGGTQDRQGDFVIDYIDFDGRKFSFNEGVNTTVSNSDGTETQSITTDRGVENMWNLID